MNTDSEPVPGGARAPTPVLVERPDIFNLYELMSEVEAAIRRATAERIRLLGSDGKA